jgi:co-chaperonin GroES (HSP10)
MTEVINGTPRMLGDRILLKPLDWDASKTIIAIRHGRPVRGEVVAVGPGIHPVSKRTNLPNGQKRVDFSKRFRPTEVKVGDIVELGGLNQFDGQGYQFPEVVVNGHTHIVVTERDVCGVRTDGEAA